MKRIKDYTIDEIKSIAKSYNDKTEFHKKHYRLYEHCKNMGWLEELGTVLPRKRKWSVEKLKEEALKYSTRGEFMKANISAYNTALNSGHYDEIISHMGDPNKFQQKIKWTYENVRDLYLKCKTLKELRVNHGQKVITVAKKNGWHDELSKHFMKEQHPNLYWTFEKVKKEAEKYKTRKEFGKNNPSAYQRAIAMEWMDAISSHMIKGYTKWTKEKMMEIISDCKTMKDIKEKSPSLYVYIKRHNLQENLFNV